jgi:hypothetical protein
MRGLLHVADRYPLSRGAADLGGLTRCRGFPADKEEAPLLAAVNVKAATLEVTEL